MPVVCMDQAFVKAALCPEGKSKIDYYTDSRDCIGLLLEVRKSGGRTFYFRWRDQRGTQRQFKVGDASAISLNAAKQAVQKLRSKVTLGHNPLDEKKVMRSIPTLAELYRDTYLPFLRTYRRNLQADLSFWKVQVLPRFAHRHLDQITQHDVIQAHREILASGLKPASANRIIIQIRYAFNVAKKAGIPGTEVNPAVGVKLFECNNARERYLTAEETERLRQALDASENPQLKHIVAFLLLAGCRKREFLDSQWQDFDLERRVWRIPISKNGKARHVPLSDAALTLLGQLPRWKGCSYVVPNPATLKPYGNLFYPWDKARKVAGLPDLRMHDLRHSFASNLVNSGRSIFEVSRLLGHSQIRTTQRYSHLDQETLLCALDAAANALGNSWVDTKPSV